MSSKSTVKVERGKSPDPRSSPENRAKAPEPQAVVTATNEQAHRAPDDARVSHAAKPVVKPAVHTSENAVVASTSKRVSEVSVPTGTSISRSGVAQPHNNANPATPQRVEHSKPSVNLSTPQGPSQRDRSDSIELIGVNSLRKDPAGGSESGFGKKKPAFVFSQAQKKYLDARFEENQHPEDGEHERFAKAIGGADITEDELRKLTNEVVKWFINRATNRSRATVGPYNRDPGSQPSSIKKKRKPSFSSEPQPASRPRLENAAAPVPSSDNLIHRALAENRFNLNALKQQEASIIIRHEREQTRYQVDIMDVRNRIRAAEDTIKQLEEMNKDNEEE